MARRSKPFAYLRQWPVGQGGLHTFQFLPGDEHEFTGVYDCGSRNPVPLHRSLRLLDEELDPARKLDLLMLSHLDDDHVNGVEMLLAHRDVDTVVIPLLREEDRIVLIAKAALRLTEATLDLYENPIEWFRVRGARRVIEVEPTGDADPPAPPEPQPPDQNRPPGGPCELDGLNLRGLDVTDGHATLGPGGSFHLRNGRVLLWEIVPYWRPDDAAAGFAATVRRAFACKRLTASALRKILLDKPKRRRLASLYTSTFGDRNLTSMITFSSPLSGTHEALIQTGEHFYSTEPCNKLGWFQTGDAPFNDRQLLAGFLRFYGSRFARTLLFALPHHGSIRSFPPRLIFDLDFSIWLALSGKNNHGHPSETLKRLAKDNGDFFRVSSAPQSMLSVRVPW